MVVINSSNIKAVTYLLSLMSPLHNMFHINKNEAVQRNSRNPEQNYLQVLQNTGKDQSCTQQKEPKLEYPAKQTIRKDKEWLMENWVGLQDTALK